MVEYFASTTLPELATVLATVFTGFGAMLLGFYKYAQSREKDFAEQRKISQEAYAKSNEHLKTALDKVAESNKEIANKTERVAISSEKNGRESEQRNGHLGELILKQGEQTQRIADKAIEQIISQVKVQNVEHQHIKDSVVEKETIKVKE